MSISTVRIAVAAIIIAVSAPAGGAQPLETVTVFAAASLKTALDDVHASLAGRMNARVVASYAATPALVRQIDQGAPADVFASADREWMDDAIKRGLVNPATRVDLLGNRLVLITARDSKVLPVVLAPGIDLIALAGGGRIVTGEIKSVPAGRYAAAALRSLGLWAAVEPRIAMVENVRVALTLVARGEAALGIVYATDASAEPAVRIVATFPTSAHPPIVYPVAATTRAGASAAGYLGVLRSTAAAAIFQRHGFAVLAKPTL